MNDIEILKEFIKYYETEYFKGKKLNSSIKIIVDEDDVEAIKNLIQRNKDLKEIEQEHKEENGRLRDKIKDLEKEIIYWKEQAEGYQGLAEQIKEDFENRDRWE